MYMYMYHCTFKYYRNVLCYSLQIVKENQLNSKNLVDGQIWWQVYLPEKALVLRTNLVLYGQLKSQFVDKNTIYILHAQ